MPKTDNVRQVDLPRSGSGGSVYIRGGNAGGVSNADTVDGYHASSTPTAGKLLALDASAQFDPSVIEWADVAGAGLGASGDTLVVQWGTSPTTIVPDASTDGGSAATSARSDHRHSIATDVAGSIQPDDTAAEGTATTFARSDHRHAIAAAAPTSNLTVTSANAEGNATSFARSNHTHAITTSANPGAAASILASDSSGYLRLVRLGLGVAPSYALHAQSAAPQLRIQSDASHYATFGADGSGNLTILPSGNSLLLDGDKTLSSDDWASQTTGWGIYPESTHGRSGYADFRYIYADELHVKAFIADLEQALAGGQIISKSVAIISRDFTVPAKGAWAYLYVEDLPGTEANVFEDDDWVRIRNIDRSGGGLIVADCYGQVEFLDRFVGEQRWVFKRPAGDTGSALSGAVIKKGGLALDYGTSGDGFWEVTTLDPAGSPYAQVATWATHPQTLTVRARLGNLDGIAGIGAEWGLWAGGTYSGMTGARYIKASDAGLVLYGVPQTWLDGAGNTRGEVLPDATGTNALFRLGPGGGDWRFTVQADGVVLFGSIPSQHVAGWAHGSDTTKIDGGDIYAGSVTAAQMSVTGFNLVDNPGFEYWSSTTAANGWALHADAVRTSSTVRSGTYCLAVPGTGAVKTVALQDLPATAGASYYLEGWVYLSSPASGITRNVRWVAVELDAAGQIIAGTYHNPTEGLTTTRGVWTRQTCLFTTASNCAKVRVYLYVGADLVAGEYARGDDVSLRAASGMNLLVGTAGSARVEINNSGISAYNSVPTQKFNLGVDGTFWFGAASGDNSIVYNGTTMALTNVDLSITDGGFTLASASSGTRIQMTNTAIAGYNGADIQFQLRASDGRALFGGGEGMIDATGLMMSGNETTEDTFNAVRWLDGTLPAGNEVARLSAGKFTSSLPQIYLIANPTRSYAAGRLFTGSLGGPSGGISSVAGLYTTAGSGAGHVSLEATGTGGTAYVEVESASSAWSIRMGVRYTTTALVTSSGLSVTGVVNATGGGTFSNSNENCLAISRAAGNTRGLRWYSGTSVRWQIGADNTAESGSNVGSDFGVWTYTDAGVYLTKVAAIARSTGNAWFVGNVSALSFTDRTPYPDKATALAAVLSMRQQGGKADSLDHAALNPYVRAGEGEDEGRNLSATVSAQNVVIQDLLKRIDQLERGVRL